LVVAHDATGLASTSARELAFDAHSLAALRRLVASWAAEEMLGAEATEELVLAVDELASNSVRHGGGRGRLRAWRQARWLVCEVRDAGHIVDGLTVGRERPPPEAHSGRGLWLVNQLCDRVAIRSSPAGTAVRVHKRLA
jgi:anti-sigma regulatory factor (Ser/Thr protein kinase)